MASHAAAPVEGGVVKPTWFTEVDAVGWGKEGGKKVRGLESG
jgi:hypothetical protein